LPRRRYDRDGHGMCFEAEELLSILLSKDFVSKVKTTELHLEKGDILNVRFDLSLSAPLTPMSTTKA